MHSVSQPKAPPDRQISAMAQQQSALFAFAANHHLANAPDWSSFKINDLHASLGAALVVRCSQPSELLHALAPVLARGMQLLSEQQLDVTTLQQHQQGVMALLALCTEWGLALVALERHPAKERGFASLATQITQTGMLKAHGQLCRTLARFISSRAAHSAAAAAAFKRSSIPQLIVQQLWLLLHVVHVWPGSKALSNPAVAAAVPAASELAVAALHNANRQWTEPPGSSNGDSDDGSSSNSNSDPSTGLRIRSTAEAATAVAAAICDSPVAASGDLALPECIAGSSAVMQLLLAHLALTAQAIHQQQRGLAAVAAGGAAAAAAGTSDQRQQQVAVPAYHQQLLDALGMAEAVDLQLLDSDAASLQGMLWLALSGVRCVRFQRPHSSSSSTATAGQQQQQQQAGAAVDASLLAPLLFVLLECCPLLACCVPAAACVSNMTHFMADCWDCIPESLARDLPPAMLQLLLPAIRAADAAAAAAPGASATGPPTSGLADAATNVLLMLSTNAALERGPDWQADSSVRALAAAFLEQPQQFCALIEGPFRSKVASSEGYELWTAAVAALLSAAAAYASSEGVSLSAGEQQRVFSLLISCLKAVAAEPAVATLLAASSNVLVHMACALLHSTSSGSSQAGATVAAGAPAAVGAGSGRLAVHLLGRCLVSAGRDVQLANSVEAGSHPQISRLGLDELLADVAQELQLLTAPAVPEPVLQQLLGQQAALQQQLQALLDQPAAGGGPSAAAASSSGLAQQLEAFGAAVCAQVPVKHCCNHHLCSNTSQRSELELVGGKSCVCSCCRAARYCSRECQVAHYKSWHRAVCKRLQQQQAAQ